MAWVSRTGLSVTPARRLPPAPARNSTVDTADASQFSLRCARTDVAATAGGQRPLGWGFSCVVQHDTRRCVRRWSRPSSRRWPGQATSAASQGSRMDSGSAMIGATPAGAGIGHLEPAARRGACGRFIFMPVTAACAGSLPAWCSVSTPVMWSSTTTTSSARPCRTIAGRRCPPWPSRSPRACAASGTPLTTGARPACTSTVRAAVDGEFHRLACCPGRCRASSTVTRPSFLLPPVRWCTPPSAEHLRAVFGWWTHGPPPRPGQRTLACSGPSQRSVSIFTFRLQ